jgi:hypothetical protein
MNTASYKQSGMACVMIVVPSFVDLMIDFYVITHNYFIHGKSIYILLKPEENSKAFLLTMMELPALVF